MISKLCVEDWLSRSNIAANMGAMESLPPEMFQKILYYLDMKGMQSTALINSTWNKASIVAAKHKAFSEIRTLAEFLVQNLPESYEDQRKKLVDISVNRKIFESVNLIQLKLSIKKYKEDIIFILEVLKYEDLKKILEAVSKDKIKSEFLEDFFEFFYGIAEIYERIDWT